jgi:uncharacterized protein
MSYQTLPSQSQRIEVIDVLRGFTLFGIALVHMVEQYYAGQPPQNIPGAVTPTLADNIAQGFAGIFIMGKFYMIFSFLFGLSFFIQLDKRDSDGNFLVRFAWRLLILFAIGFLHHIHYRGDILTIYAILGFALLLFYRLPDKYLLVLSLLLIFNIPSLLTRAFQLTFASSAPSIFDQDPAVLMSYYNTVKSGSYFDVLYANIFEFTGKMQFQVFSGRLYITLGLFLLGIYAGRKRLFENLQQHTPFVKRWIKNALWLLLACVVLGAAIFGGAYLLKIDLPQQAMMMIGGVIYDVFNTAMAILYTGWILLLFQKVKWQKRLMVLYPVGRMGLTVYLLQTAFGSLVFFGYGLGLLFSIGAFTSLMLGLGFFIFQVIFAHLWFRHFTYGPVEWLWRNLTYFKIYPMVRQKPSVATE